MKIGWIGLGNMGIPMASNLLAAGYDLHAWNRTADKAAPLIELGAKFAATLSQLVDDCDILFSMVSDDEAVKAIYTGPAGLLAAAVKGKSSATYSRAIVKAAAAPPGNSLLLRY